MVILVGVVLSGIILWWDCRCVIALRNLSSQSLTVVGVVVIPTLLKSRLRLALACV